MLRGDLQEHILMSNSTIDVSLQVGRSTPVSSRNGMRRQGSSSFTVKVGGRALSTQMF